MTLEKTENILNDFSITPKQLNNLKYYLCSLVKKTAFIANNESYWEHLRNSFLNYSSPKYSESMDDSK